MKGGDFCSGSDSASVNASDIHSEVQKTVCSEEGSSRSNFHRQSFGHVGCDCKSSFISRICCMLSNLSCCEMQSRSVADCVRRHWNEFRTDPIGGFLNSIKFLRMQTGTATELLLAELEDLASHLDASLCSLMAAESLFVYKQILDNLNHLLSFQQNRKQLLT